MKEKGLSIIKSFLAAYALTVKFSLPLQKEHYGDVIDYMIASVYELLGSYQFMFVVIGVVLFLFFERCQKRKMAYSVYSGVTAGFFAACILLGNSFYETNGWDYCFGSIINLIKTALAFVGYFFLFREIVELIFVLFANAKIKTETKHFFSKHAFGKCFGILSVIYFAVLILSFPGNLCWDVIGQLEQVTVENVGFNQHHPLVHTLLVGGLTQAGEVLFGSKEIGLFAYMIVQNLLLIAALSATVHVLAQRNYSFGVLMGMVVLYCISPIYTNLASTAIKDIPFVSFVIGYMICFALLLEKPERIGNPKFAVIFVIMQIGTILMRNNGLPLVLICGIAGMVFLWKKYAWKQRIYSAVTMVLASIVITKIFVTILAMALGAEAGGKAEMFSLPMQQTARYLTYYENELTTTERQGIEGVFDDISAVVSAYDPDIADPVKALFDNEAPMSDVLAYFKAWLIGLCRHPLVYLEAACNHVYGWFSPTITNALRYETEYEEIKQGQLFPMSDKVMIFIYRFADRMPVIGVLQNAGFYVWILIIMTAYCIKDKRNRMLILTSPLWVSLLICMASPCFFLHPRYALPIIMGVPFVMLFGISMGCDTQRG